MCVVPLPPSLAAAQYGVQEKDPTKWGWGLHSHGPHAAPHPHSGGGPWGAAAPHLSEGCKHPLAPTAL